MKQWILNTFFSQELKDASIEAFRLAHKDILASREDDIEERAEELSQVKLAQLLSVVDESQIISVDKRAHTVLLGEQAIEASKLANLKAEAHFFLESDLWSVLYETPKKLAEQAMFVDDGKLETQLLKGRAVLYTLATQKKILSILKDVPTSGP